VLALGALQFLLERRVDCSVGRTVLLCMSCGQHCWKGETDRQSGRRLRE